MNNDNYANESTDPTMDERISDRDSNRFPATEEDSNYSEDGQESWQSEEEEDLQPTGKSPRNEELPEY